MATDRREVTFMLYISHDRAKLAAGAEKVDKRRRVSLLSFPLTSSPPPLFLSPPVTLLRWRKKRGGGIKIQ